MVEVTVAVTVEVDVEKNRSLRKRATRPSEPEFTLESTCQEKRK